MIEETIGLDADASVPRSGRPVGEQAVGTRSVHVASLSGDGEVRSWTPMPAVGRRYWGALCLVSVLGADLGDVLSRSLHLGYWHGLPPLAVLFALTMLAARVGPRSEAYYWVGVTIARTAATNLADWETLSIGLPMPATAAAFGVALAVLVARRRFSAASALPVADGCFWAAMLAAGTVGTAIGDDLAFGQDLGPPLASACTTLVLVAAFWWRARSRAPEIATFWTVVVFVRTWGTNVGDMTADRWGLITCAAIVLVLFVGLLLAWRPKQSASVAIVS